MAEMNPLMQLFETLPSTARALEENSMNLMLAEHNCLSYRSAMAKISVIVCAFVDECRYNVELEYNANKLDCHCPQLCTWVSYIIQNTDAWPKTSWDPGWM